MACWQSGSHAAGGLAADTEEDRKMLRLASAVTTIEKQLILNMEVTCMFADREEGGTAKRESEG